MTHADLLAAIALEFSRGNTRLLRANAGRAWTGDIVHITRTTITLRHYRPFHGMPEGVSDLIGFSGPQFVAIEAKTGRGRASDAQQAFIDTVIAAGGRAGIARSVDDARLILAPHDT